MVRRHLGHMTDPRSRRTNHKAQVLLAHAHWAPGCHAERHYRSREDSARLDRGTVKMKEQLCGSKSGYLSNSGTRSPPSPKVSSHPLYYPQSLVIPVLSAVSGHPCAVRSLWSSLCCLQSLVIP
ncbi:unnamed protein product, partial [Staurois parvus]